MFTCLFVFCVFAPFVKKHAFSFGKSLLCVCFFPPSVQQLAAACPGLIHPNFSSHKRTLNQEGLNAGRSIINDMVNCR